MVAASLDVDPRTDTSKHAMSMQACDPPGGDCAQGAKQPQRGGGRAFHDCYGGASKLLCLNLVFCNMRSIPWDVRASKPDNPYSSRQPSVSRSQPSHPLPTHPDVQSMCKQFQARVHDSYGQLVAALKVGKHRYVCLSMLLCLRSPSGALYSVTCRSL